MLFAAFLVWLFQNAPAPAAGAGAVQGIVTRAGTAEALPKAIVELRGDDDRQPPVVSTTTESDGRFSLRNVRAGRYRLVTMRPAYVRRAATVTVTAGRTEEVAIAMTATAAISGRVYGRNGEPLANIGVAALRPAYQGGRRTLIAVESARTNDRGEYRLFWLAPGRYIVKATHPQAETGVMAMTGQSRIGASFMTSVGGAGPGGAFEIRSTGDSVVFDAFGASVDTAQDRYVPVYFPGTTDDQGAVAIDLRPGAEAGAIDLPVIPVRESRVRGVVINGATGQVAQYPGLTEVRPDALPGDFMGGPGGGLSNRGQAPLNPDGSFEVTLLPGRHTLMGTAGTGVGFVSLDVRDADIDGVRIVAMPEFKITGRIAADAPVEGGDLGTVQISLPREHPVVVRPSSYSLPRADGTFVLGATPGDYRVSVAPFLDAAPSLAPRSVPVPRGFGRAYVKSIRLGETDILNEGLHLEGPPGSPLEIVLGMNPGSVEGTVVAGATTTPAGVTVVLLPNVRGRFDLIRTGTTDPAGRFRLDRVPPGEYKLFAWSEVGDGDWQDPDFIRAYEARGSDVHTVEGGMETVRLTAIEP